jgi:hypothetical protein
MPLCARPADGSASCSYRRCTVMVVSSDQQAPTDAEVAAAWSRIVNDCGCPDIYFCVVSRK